MNYYKRHLGDYAAATRHLSILEHGVYTLLLDLYYVTEKPLPSEEKAVWRLAGARSKDEREAVSQVLNEFFELQEDGWHQARCDEEIMDAQEISGDASDKRENEKERQRRHRQRRKELFDALREHDIVPPYDTKTSELETLLSQQSSRPVTRDGHADVTPPVTPATCTSTANHYPLPNNQEKNPPNPPGGESSEKKPRERKPRIQLKTFIDQCVQAGEKPISGYQPLLTYVENTGLPMDFVQIAWDVFKREFLPPGEHANRLQADWRRHFLNYVEKGYYRLWYAKQTDAGPVYELSTQGIQAQASLRKEAA